MSSPRPSIFGIPIDPLTCAQVLERLQHSIATRLPTQVVTVNPEFLIRSRTDQAFRSVLLKADVTVSDGIGVRAAATFQNQPLPTWQPGRIIMSLLQGVLVGGAILTRHRSLHNPLPETLSGIDLIWELAELGATRGWRFFLLGGAPGTAKAAAATLQARFPTLIIAGAEEGIPRDKYGDQTLRQSVAKQISHQTPDVLFVAFGAPNQERFIAEFRDHLRVPVMMGVGGAFDFMAGTVPRAPHLIRSIGLEWFWRLIVQPWRFKRIWTAVVIFPWLVFLERQQYGGKATPVE